MRKPAMTLSTAAALLLCSLAVPAASQQPWEYSCHTSGSGDQFMKVCFGKNGAVTHFESPGGLEFLNSAHSILGSEGYAVCWKRGDTGEGSSAWALGLYEKKNLPRWGDPVASASNKLPLTVTRNTTDGTFRLKQTFTRDSAEKDITVTMELTNTSGVAMREVFLDRFFEGQPGGGAWDFYEAEVADRSRRSVTQRGKQGGSGMMLTAFTDGPVNTAVHRSGPDDWWWPRFCNETSEPVPFVGDSEKEAHPAAASRISVPFGPMRPNQVKKVEFVYRRD